jgi:histidine triad (HIT) family protein
MLRYFSSSSKPLTLFEQIIARKIPATFLHEDKHCIAIEDISPVAPVHFLVVPRKPIPALSGATESDRDVLGHVMLIAKELARRKGLDENGYRIVVNDGKHGCQSIFHLHVHVIGGRQLIWPPG